jgi:aconitate hydratase 2/2-methylisocitrate dehydratase
MSLFIEYLKEIEQRKSQELDPKPIDGAELLNEIILQIKDPNHKYRKDSLDFFIYNVLPGTTSAAVVKSKFLKEIIIGESKVEEISADFAFEQLSHMKGGSSIEVLLDIALGKNISKAKQAAKVLKHKFFYMRQIRIV